ncbi:aspartate-alanine antiporter [Limobrevibacterium gyesilva]|uniref:Aspartate-alanine antiporter n=1 Tax=Limobrevibacterium gyesilva TaxID=2991712 RepID=A0AA41YRB5_9PROT|nr:aspartate-alanine antiporter [Limobrevibacterium gyesilva]MCW3474087.1 aspartate-alanine antiporter [Limobrevibacterium gyesilva]
MPLIDWLVGALRHHPEVTFFVTIGIGYMLGKLRFGKFTLGAVTGTLLAGVLVGQLGVTVSSDVKQCFFLLFLFSIGYRCGPQFFRGLRTEGLAMAAVSAIIAVTGLVVAYAASRVLGYDPGTGGGLIAGALTESATIGTAGDAITRLPIADAQKAALINNIPVAFAVTYLVGVIGAAWFLAQIAPRILGIDLVQACKDYELQMGGGKAREPGLISSYRAVEMRAYRIPDGSSVIGKPVAQIFPGVRVFVERIRRGAQLIDADQDTVLQPGDVAAISGPRKRLVESVEAELPEVEDPELLDMPAEVLPVVVTSQAVHGQTLSELSTIPSARGVYLRRILRNRTDVPILPATTVSRGDVLTLVGTQAHLEAAVRAIGRTEHPTETTDMVFVSAGIVAGALIGIPALAFGKLEIGLSLSVGVLLGGLLWGWLNSLRPIPGSIPGPALWIFESLGLAGFVAVVGLAAGPDFVRGLQTSGPSLLLAGAVTVLIPHLVGVLTGYHIFKMHPGILLGVCAGAGTATPALAAVQEAAKSTVPTLGYGVSYAVGNVLLALWGTVIVALLA